MRRAIAVRTAGTWPADACVGTATLAYDDRHRRRVVLADDEGTPFLLDLDWATVLAEGDGLLLEGGGYIRVRAADEPVIEARGTHAAATARLAWHLGNRHTPVQVLADGGLRLKYDHVLAAMLEGLGAVVTRRAASFTPERGAYASSLPRHGGDEPA